MKDNILGEIWEISSSEVRTDILNKTEDTENFNYIKITNFSSTRDTIRRVKTQIMNLEKISETHNTDKGSEYKEL